MPTKKTIAVFGNTSNKITPSLRKETEYVDYEELAEGDCYLWNGDLWIKTNEDQIGTSLSNGTFEDNLCGTMVIPVNIEIKWSKKK
ncbi:MAG TPA: hypothetical protein ENH85_06190 [Candidatus Scalindua sp.]|nr:hypothetical protein [Candidatus Scalindua sp.]